MEDTFHKRQDKLISWVTQIYVKTFVGGVWQSQQKPKSMFKLTTCKIVAGGINFPVAEVRWAELQSNCGAWVAMLLSRKSCALTNGYSFWLSCKHSIQQLVSEPRSRVRFPKGQLLSGTIAEGKIVTAWRRPGGSSYNRIMVIGLQRS